jgi:hypothetical protein
MCNFFSCIVTKDGDVLFDPLSDSHEDIIDKYKNRYDLRDETNDPAELLFARVEITPPNGDVFHPFELWKLKIDQSIKPAWFDIFCAEAARKTAREFVEKAVLVGKELEEVSTGRYWIKDCKIATLKGDAIICQMWGSSQVNVMRESSQVNVMNDDSIAILRSGSTPKIYVANNSIAVDVTNKV